MRFTPLQRPVALAVTRLAMAPGAPSTLLVNGRVGAPSGLVLRLAPISGTGRAVTRTLAVKKGRFSDVVSLGSTLQPGSYLVTVSGHSASGPVSTLDRTLAVSGPRLGILGRSWITTARNGKPESSVSGTRKLWAYFRFSTTPSSVTKLEVTWYGPGGSGSAAKSAAPLIETFAQGTNSLPDGTWKCVLTADGKPIASVTVHVGPSQQG
jgi:hypothetical protein